MKKYLILSFVFFTILSCSDFLDIEPQQETSISEQFSSISGARIALAGAYYKAEDSQSSTFFIYPDLLGGNITFTPVQQGSNVGIITNRGLLLNSYNFNDTAIGSNFGSYYINAYNVLNNINNILTFTDGLPDATVAQKNQIKAEALALRAFMHYNLLQLYGQTYNFTSNANHKGIVYADKLFKGGIDFPARLSVAACYDLMVKDLQTAISLFTPTQALPGPKYSYFNTITTKAILARVALQKNDWLLATNTADDVIATAGTTLLTASNYVSEWEKPNLPVSEILFELSAPVANNSQLLSSTVAAYYGIVYSSAGNPPVSTVNNYSTYCASQDLLDLFANNDIRKNAFITQSLRVKVDNGFVNRNFSFTKKHQDNAGTIVCRLSEMYLIKAEANARLNNTSAALSNLNIIRNRANLPSIISTTNLLDEIFMERRRELCFETSLLFDIARFNKNVVRTNDCISNLCNLTFPNNRFVLPIPRPSIDLNTNMIQNEGY